MRAIPAAMVMLGLTTGLAGSAMAAGNVSAELTRRGDLEIEGNDESNQVLVTNDGFGNVRVVGMSGTTINGGAEWTFADTDSNTVPGRLDVDLRGGDNYLEIDGVNVERDLKIKTRNGDGTVGIFDGVFFDDLSIKMGNGNNLLTLVNVTVADKLDLKTGSGSDWVGIADCVAVGGKTKLKTGSGGDTVLLEGTYTDDIKFHAGKGGDELFVNKHASFEKVDIKLGSDSDGIVVTSSAALAGVVKLNGGSGDDLQVEDPDAVFNPAQSKSIETFIVNPAADDMPGAMLAEMSVGYVGRGGDAGDLTCP